ncbi:serine hydrolase [Streptomyces sp. SCUT-3]|uniref:serine hydrolase domain-containing protein n=1 Tax=Streptomyces TaxID=1883 RepID=UPI0015FA70FD|nr:serine hydrolase domain-containing protein [Streptomyces sp. SCUT-3]QMV22425.1 serine hydrolase [Streptomyces sp. SCUT-3]
MDSDFLSGTLREVARRHRIPGAQLSLYRDGELHEACHGVERVGGGAPVTTRSRFAYGSVSKVFTAALALQLVEDGDLDLDEPITAALGSTAVPPGHPMRSVTMRRLLSHTAGLVSDHEGEPLRSSSLRRYFESVLHVDPVGPPGAAFSYSNTGYAVAAYVVEVLSGQSWWDSLEAYLAKPAGLDLSFVHDPRMRTTGCTTVSGHAVDPRTGRAEPVDFYVESTLVAAGGVAGSATDLVAFGRAFLPEADAAEDCVVAGPEVLAEMGRPVPAADPFGLAAGWGAGWGLFPAGGGASGDPGGPLWLGHDGTLDGGSCNVRVNPSTGTALAFTTNSTTGLAAWEDLADALDDAGLRVGRYRQPAPSSLPYRAGERLTGEYVNGDLGIRVSPGRGGSLRFDVRNGLSGVLTVGSDLTFSVRTADRDEVVFSGRFLASRGSGPVDLMQYNGRTLCRSEALVRHVA